MRDLNFFSPYIENRKSNKSKTPYYIAIIVFLFLFASAFYGWNAYSIINMEKEISEIDSYLSSAKIMQSLKSYEEVKEKTKTLKDYQVIVEDINNRIENSDQINTTLLDNLSKELPMAIELNVVSITREGMHIQGVSKTRVAVAEYIYNLKQTKAFETVHASSINEILENGNGYIFTLTCKLGVKSINEVE